MANVREAIRQQIVEEFLDGDDANLDDETRLVEEEIIDSLGIFLLLGFIKEEFGHEVDPEDVTLENFATIPAIVDLISSQG